MRSRLVWRQIHWSEPVSAERAAALLRTWASDQRSPRIVLEARASQGEVRYLLGADPAASTHIFAALTSLTTARLTTSGTTRVPIAQAGHLRANTRHRPLRTRPLELQSTVRALLGALSQAGEDEELVVQIVLGPRRVPLAVPTNSPSAIVSPWYEVAWRGNGKQVDSEKRAALRDKVSDHGFACMVRIGARATAPARTQALGLGVLAAMRTSESSGVQLRLRGERPAQLTEASVGWRWPLRLNVSELVGLTAWPVDANDLPGQPAAHPRRLPPPSVMPRWGRIIASADAPGVTDTLRLSAGDALRHTHVLGPTGSGKSHLLLNLISQDIADDRAVVVIEPRGDLVDDVLARIPERRHGDVVVLDAADASPVGLNPLAAVPGRSPEVAADSVLSIFKSLYGDSLGPRSTDILHAGLLTLAMQPDANLVRLPLLLTNQAYRRRLTRGLGDPIALGPFWASFERWSEGEQAAAIAPLMNKLRPLLRPSLRAILAQPEPRFSIREVFTKRRILLVPLRRGVIGPDAAALLGSLVVSELWQATQERAAIPRVKRHPAMVYIDEVQDYLHLPTDLGDALAQARGLGVGFTLAHQLLGQLPTAMKAAVLANARSRVTFQTTAADAGELVKGHPEVTPEDLTSLGQYEVYASLYAGGQVHPYASGRTLPAAEPMASPDAIRAISREYYGVPRADIEAHFTALADDPSSTAGIERTGRRARSPRGGTA